MRPPNVFTIPAGVPFLDALVAALIEGRLVAGFRADDPFALADVTLYLPTRRAARAIRERFIARMGRPVLLPRIRTLGGIDEDESGVGDLDSAELPSAVPAMERQLVLTRLVLGWSGAFARAAADLGSEELAVPASPADAARLAYGLGGLMDQVGTAPEAWQGLFKDANADHAKYWAITLEFLRIATEFWPAHLAERGMIDPGTRRDALIRAEAARLLAVGSEDPIIAAGSTGSVPATAALLAAIAKLPNGAVVLPGLDQDLDEESWRAIGPSAEEPAGAGHPQYGLKLLLETLGVKREHVEQLAAPSASRHLRERFVSESMRPATTTERWSSDPALSALEKAEATESLSLVEARNEREEALAVAAILRSATETPGTVAALVTPERGLARRVAVELKRWGIEVDDSAGRPLSTSSAGIFARLVATVALGGAAAEPLLAMLKHPLAGFGAEQFETRRAARKLERVALRGPRLKPGLPELRQAVDNAIALADAEAPHRTNEAARGLSRADRAAAQDLADRVATMLAPLARLAEGRGPVPLPDLVEAHLSALLAASGDGKGRTTLFTGDSGEALALAFEEFRASAPRFAGGIEPRDYPSLFTALIERIAVRRRGVFDPRIHIWGALEARLQSVDLIILGGLNEGGWPAQTRLDPLLSRPMRAALELEPPERRIGLAAHDFAQALGHPEVWLTRAERQDGEPRVASRWLQRLLAHAGKNLADAMRQRGSRALGWARLLDAPERIERAERPRPSPPPELRPKQLSVTRIETLIRDPYAIYAREILRLRPFEPLAKLPDAAERGTLIHGILDRFVGERPAGPFDAAALERLLEIGREEFALRSDFPEVTALWWPRFERIARWFVSVEAARKDVLHRHVEGSGRIEVTPDFTLTARADRIDRRADSSLAIIDYKTGAPPKIDEVLALSPQLPLEGLIARRGGFEGVPAGEPSELVYYRLSGRDEGGTVEDRSGRAARGGRPAISLPQALAMAEERLHALVAQFAEPGAQYPSRKIPKRGRVFVGDYDHLARVAEWTTTEDEDDQWPVPS